MSTEPIDLDALRRLEAAATEAPWDVYDSNEGMCPPRPGWSVANDAYHNPPGDDEGWAAVNIFVETGLRGDAEFIAAARNAMPSLLAELDRYHALHDWLATHAPGEAVDHWDLAEQLAKVNEVTTRRPVPVTVEWAAEVSYLSGEVRYAAAASVLAASVTAHGVNEHVASLNEPTRELNGVEGARVVSREVREFPDGSRLIGPWKPVESAAEVS